MKAYGKRMSLIVSRGLGPEAPATLVSSTESVFEPLALATSLLLAANCAAVGQREAGEVGSKVERDALGGGGEAVGDVKEEEEGVASSQETATGRGEGRSERAGGQHALKGGGGESHQEAIRDGGQSGLRVGGEAREAQAAVSTPASRTSSTRRACLTKQRNPALRRQSDSPSTP